jgi:hypothetical protein
MLLLVLYIHGRSVKRLLVSRQMPAKLGLLWTREPR